MSEMDRQARLELTKTHHAFSEKIVYFLLASAGASIGFVINQRETLLLAWPDLLLIMAIALWGLSFWAGIASLRSAVKLIGLNARLLEQQGFSEPQFHEALKETARPRFDYEQKRLRFWKNVQFLSLVGGAGAVLVQRIAAGYPWFNPFDWLTI